MPRGHRLQHQAEEAKRRMTGVYAQPKLPPDLYVGDFDEIPVGLPGVAPCTVRTCCCCLNAGEFETIRNREGPSRALGWSRLRKNTGDSTEPEASKTQNEQQSVVIGGEGVDRHRQHERVALGRQGWRVCLLTTLCPIVLPCRAYRQHRNITDLYPLESRETDKSGPFGRIAAALFFPWMLARHVAFLRERFNADEVRYPWQTRAAWTVAGRPPSALFKVLVLGDDDVGKTALARSLCGRGFSAEYRPRTAVSISARSYSREGYPPAIFEIWDVPASTKAETGAELVEEASCVVLLLDLGERSSFRVATRWHALMAEASSRRAGPPLHFIMVGTKIDVTPATNCGFLKEAQEWCEEQGCPLLFCTSLTGEGVMGILQELVVSCFELHPPPAVLKQPYL